MNEITLAQGIMLTVLAIIAGLDSYLEVVFIFRPIIVCTLTGIILGDLQTGIIAGGLTELIFAGLTPAGGTQPPNPVVAGIMTTVLAYTTGADIKTTVGLALPFSFLMQYIILFYYSSFSMFVPKFTEYAEQGNVKKYNFLVMVTTVIVALSYGIVIFLCTYIAQEPMRHLVETMPAWLSHGFEIAGGILPAVGFALLLRIMLRKEFAGYLIIGFLMASFLNFPNLLPVALAGTALALIQYYTDKQRGEDIKKALDSAGTRASGGDYDEGI